MRFLNRNKSSCVHELGFQILEAYSDEPLSLLVFQLQFVAADQLEADSDESLSLLVFQLQFAAADQREADSDEFLRSTALLCCAAVLSC